MTAIYRVSPLTDWTIFTTPEHKRRRAQFSASWSSTLEQLRKELEHLKATDVVLEIDVKPGNIRQDGMMRADAKVNHPGVRLSFQTREHGALSRTCDTYNACWDMSPWQANVRAIVLTLEALRAVDRYGASSGEQYVGFRALGAGSGATPMGATAAMTATEAREVLEQHSGIVVGASGSNSEARAYRIARGKTHPDRHGGDQTEWDRVAEAAKVLGL